MQSSIQAHGFDSCLHLPLFLNINLLPKDEKLCFFLVQATLQIIKLRKKVYKAFLQTIKVNAFLICVFAYLHEYK